MENKSNIDYLVEMAEDLPKFQSRAREEGIREGRKQVIEELKAFQYKGIPRTCLGCVHGVDNDGYCENCEAYDYFKLDPLFVGYIKNVFITDFVEKFLNTMEKE